MHTGRSDNEEYCERKEDWEARGWVAYWLVEVSVFCERRRGLLVVIVGIDDDDIGVESCNCYTYLLSCLRQEVVVQELLLKSCC